MKTLGGHSRQAFFLPIGPPHCGWLRDDNDNIGVTERARRKEALPKPAGDELGD
jgi:hypothetical protein